MVGGVTSCFAAPQGSVLDSHSLHLINDILPKFYEDDTVLSSIQNSSLHFLYKD